MDDQQCLRLDPTLEKQLKGHRGGVTALAYSPNDCQIASSSMDKSVLLWDLDIRGNIRSYRFQGHDEAVTDVTFSPTGRYMATASRDRNVRIWVPTVTGSSGMFRAHSQTVRSVRFNPDGTKLITASDDKIVKLWTSDKFKFISSFVGHTNWVRCAHMSSDGSIIASCSDDKTTRLWDPNSGQQIHTYKSEKGHGLYLAWHPSGCYVAVASSHGNVKLYDVRTHNLVQYYSIHDNAVTQVAFHPSGSYIITSSKDGTIKILDLLEGHPIFTLSGHGDCVNAVQFSSSGDTFASAGDDKVVFIWKTNFTQLENNIKDDMEGEAVCPRGGQNKGPKAWYLCYHSFKYPITSYVHNNEPKQPEVHICRTSCTPPPVPKANSTFVDCTADCPVNTPVTNNCSTNTCKKTSCQQRTPQRLGSPELNCYEVGHISHIPRIPPSPATYTIPSILNQSTGTEAEPVDAEELYGMIKLKETDVCYTNGTIEWVGRKRSYPNNTGFKILSDNNCSNGSGHKSKKMKSMDNTVGCECADVLPTVNAIVDHLNAIHEAVDLVDLRLNTVEAAMINKSNMFCSSQCSF